MVKLDSEFKPSPRLKGLYSTYLLLITAVIVMPLLLPLIIFSHALISTFLTVFLLLLLLFAALWIPKFYGTIFYKLTRNEIFWRRGVWFKTTGIVPYNRITNIDITQGPLSRAFGLSSLRIQTAGYSARNAASAEIRLDGIANPNEVRDFIMGLIDKKKPMAVETFESGGTDEKILKELVKIRNLLKPRK